MLVSGTPGGAMPYVRLGRSGLQVSRLCLGTMNFGPVTSEADSVAIMDRALDEGVNFFDTANVYGWKTGEGVTEQILGRWLAAGGPSPIRVLQTIISDLRKNLIPRPSLSGYDIAIISLQPL